MHNMLSTSVTVVAMCGVLKCKLHKMTGKDDHLKSWWKTFFKFRELDISRAFITEPIPMLAQLLLIVEMFSVLIHLFVLQICSIRRVVNTHNFCFVIPVFWNFHLLWFMLVVRITSWFHKICPSYDNVLSYKCVAAKLGNEMGF